MERLSGGQSKAESVRQADFGSEGVGVQGEHLAVVVLCHALVAEESVAEVVLARVGVFGIQNFGLVADDPYRLGETKIAHRVIGVERQHAGIELNQLGEEFHSRDDPVVAADRGWAEVAQQIGRAKRKGSQTDKQNPGTHHAPILLEAGAERIFVEITFIRACCNIR